MDNNFDPDAYLADKAPAAGGFDPDAYLAAKGPQQSGLESAARGALRNVPFAQQAAAAVAPINPFAEKGNYSDELAHLTEAAEQGKAQNPKSYYAGATAGTVAPMLLPMVGGALKSGAGTMAALELAGGAGAAGGAANAASQSVSDVNLTKPTGRDAANAAMAAALGGTLGKMFGGPKVAPSIGKEAENLAAPAASAVVPDVAQEASGAAAIPDVLKTAATSAVPAPQVPQRFGMTHKPLAPDFVPSHGRLSASMVAQGLGGTPRQQMKLYIGKDPVEALNGIGAWMKTADNGKSVVGLMDRPGELLQRIQAVHDSAGKAIGDVIEKVAPGANADGGQLAFQLDHLLEGTYNPTAEHTIAKLQSQIQKAEEAGRLDFQALQKIKSSFGKEASAASHDQGGAAIKEAYGILNQYMNDAVEQFGANVKDPSIMAKYAKAKIDYTKSSNLLPLLRYQEAKELMGGPGGHVTLLGLLEKAVHEGAEVLGVPAPQKIVKNAFLKAGSEFAPPVAPPPVAGAAAPVATAVSGNAMKQAAQLELANALESKFGSKKNERR